MIEWQQTWAQLVIPLTLWICVSVTLRYGIYGDFHMVLGPSSSRLFKANSVFVKQIEARNYNKQGVMVYGFSKKPELSLDRNWSVSNYATVESYSRKGFSLWLNKGSTIRLRWDAQLQVYLRKGEPNYVTLLPNSTGFVGPNDSGEADYKIEEDDMYYVDVINSSPRSVSMAMNMSVSSKIYDTTKPNSLCSTVNGSCRVNLGFPHTQFVIVTTPNNGDINGWYVELSFVVRLASYMAILAVLVVVILLMWKCLGTYEGRHHEDEQSVGEISEINPLMPEKTLRLPYGTDEEDLEAGKSGSSSEDLYDRKICTICYDMPRNCFYVPCGHCVTCYNCTRRIMDGGNKVCPICRRLIGKVRKVIVT